MHKSSTYMDILKSLRNWWIRTNEQGIIRYHLMYINITLFKDCKIWISDTDPIYLFIYSFSSGTCPEDYLDVDNVECVPDRNNCTMINGVKKCRGLESECPENATFFKAHGPLTGYCILSDR